MTETAITDRGVRELANCHKLATLSLEDTQVTDAAIPLLAAMKSLRIVSFFGTGVTDVAALTNRGIRVFWDKPHAEATANSIDDGSLPCDPCPVEARTR